MIGLYLSLFDLYTVTRTFDFEHAFILIADNADRSLTGLRAPTDYLDIISLDFILVPVSQLITYLLKKPSDPCAALQLKCTKNYRGPYRCYGFCGRRVE